MRIKHQFLDTLPARKIQSGEVVNLFLRCLMLFIFSVALVIVMEVLLVMADYMLKTESLPILKKGQLAVLFFLILDPLSCRAHFEDLLFRNVLEWKDARIQDLYSKPVMERGSWRLRIIEPVRYNILNLENKHEISVEQRVFSRLEKGEKISLVVGARSKAVLAVKTNISWDSV